MKKSYHIGGGFWAHVTWDKEGKIGVDQNNRKWMNKDNPVPKWAPLQAWCEFYGEIVKLQLKSKIC